MGSILGKDLNYLIELYNETLENTLKSVEKILKSELNLDDPDLMEIFNDYFDKSMDSLIEKWKLGKKFLRTYTVMKAFNGEPINSTRSILLIDAIINILDDLIDETLVEKEMHFYVVELIRALADYQLQSSTDEEREQLSAYLNKCITIALLERHYYDLIKSEESYDEILRCSRSIYQTRSLDMDIFIQISLMGRDDLPARDIIRAGRIHRALELLKKDVLDFEHDVKHDTDTIFTIFRDDEETLRRLVDDISGTYLLKARELAASHPHEAIVANFASMIESEGREIETIRKTIAQG